MGNVIKYFKVLSVQGWCPVGSVGGAVFLCKCSLPISCCVPIGVDVYDWFLCAGFVAYHLGCLFMLGVAAVVVFVDSVGSWFLLFLEE